jgi:acetyl esterase
MPNGDGSLLTVVWVHGGGWVSGNEDQIANYAKILASKGFTLVDIDYSVAPAKTFPVPIRQLNVALSYLVRNAERFRMDANRIVLAGDSGGSEIAAVMAGAVTEPTYARSLAIVPLIMRSQLAGVLLYCGAYTLDGIRLDGPFGSSLTTVLWSYSGSKDFLTNPAFAKAWIINYITPAFPPAFISAGNGDPSCRNPSLWLTRSPDLECAWIASSSPAITGLRYPTNTSSFWTTRGKLALESSIEFLGTLQKDR